MHSPVANDAPQPDATPALTARSVLFDADGEDGELDAAQIDPSRLSEHQLL